MYDCSLYVKNVVRVIKIAYMYVYVTEKTERKYVARKTRPLKTKYVLRQIFTKIRRLRKEEKPIFLRLQKTRLPSTRRMCATCTVYITRF